MAQKVNRIAAGGVQFQITLSDVKRQLAGGEIRMAQLIIKRRWLPENLQHSRMR